MAALVTASFGSPLPNVGNVGPTLLATGADTDLSTPDTSVVLDTRGVSLLAIQAIFANYTGVTVKAQRSLDGATWSDVTDATTSTSGGYFAFDPQAPMIRLSLAATLSASADSLTVWAYAEYSR